MGKCLAVLGINGSIPLSAPVRVERFQRFAVLVCGANPDGSPVFTPAASGMFNLQNGVRDSIYNPGFNNWNLGLFNRLTSR